MPTINTQAITKQLTHNTDKQSTSIAAKQPTHVTKELPQNGRWQGTDPMRLCSIRLVDVKVVI
jgi:hypothetical protein